MLPAARSVPWSHLHQRGTTGEDTCSSGGYELPGRPAGEAAEQGPTPVLDSQAHSQKQQLRQREQPQQRQHSGARVPLPSPHVPALSHLHLRLCDTGAMALLQAAAPSLASVSLERGQGSEWVSSSSDGFRSSRSSTGSRSTEDHHCSGAGPTSAAEANQAARTRLPHSHPCVSCAVWRMPYRRLKQLHLCKVGAAEARREGSCRVTTTWDGEEDRSSDRQPSERVEFVRLESLILDECPDETPLPLLACLTGNPSRHCVSDGQSGCHSGSAMLRQLSLQHCRRMRVVCLENPLLLSCLQHVHIASCCNLSELRINASAMPLLTSVHILHCTRLRQVVMEEGSGGEGRPLQHLKEVEIVGCCSLAALHMELLHSPSLIRLKVRDCPQLCLLNRLPIRGHQVGMLACVPFDTRVKEFHLSEIGEMYLNL